MIELGFHIMFNLMQRISTFKRYIILANRATWNTWENTSAVESMLSSNFLFNSRASTTVMILSSR